MTWLQVRPHPVACSLPCSGMGERIRRAKVKKLVGQDKDSLIGKAKAAHTSKANQGIHSPLPIGRQAFSHLQESGAPPCVMVTWEDKCHHSKHSSLPPALYAEHDVIWCGIILQSVGVSCPGCVPSQLLVYPQPTTKHHPATCSLPLSGMGERIRRVKVRKFMG